MADNGHYGELKTRLGKDSALSNKKYLCTLTMPLALLRDFMGVSGAKRNNDTANNNSKSLHRVKGDHGQRQQQTHGEEGVFWV